MSMVLDSSGLEPRREVKTKYKNIKKRGAWVAPSVKHLTSAQIMIPKSWDQAPCWAPCSAGSLLLPLPLLLLVFPLSLAVSISVK